MALARGGVEWVPGQLNWRIFLQGPPAAPSPATQRQQPPRALLKLTAPNPEAPQRCVNPVSRQAARFREHADAVQFSGFLIAKLEAIRKKKTYYWFGV